MPAIVVYEVCRKITSKISTEKALATAALLRQYGILVLNDEVALHAIDLSLEHGLAMADSIVLAHAYRQNALLLTLDNDFRKIKGAKIL